MKIVTRARVWALERKVKKLEKIIERLITQLEAQGEYIRRKQDQEAEYY